MWRFLLLALVPVLAGAGLVGPGPGLIGHGGGVASNSPSLLFDFRGGSLTAQTGGVTLSFTRATTGGGCWNASGVLEYPASGEPCFDHDPALNNKPLGYRQFPQYVNEILQSEALGTTWSQAGTPTLSENTAAAPDGATTCDTGGDNSAAALEFFFQDITIANSETFTTTSFIRKDNDQTRFPSIGFDFQGGSTRIITNVNINTETGAVGFNHSLGGGLLSPRAGTVDFGDWWLVWFTGSNNATGNTTGRVRFMPAHSDGMTTENVATTGTAIFCGASLTETDNWVPYIPTTTSTVTVNADSLAATTDVGWLARSVGTLLVSARVYNTQAHYIQISDGTDNNRLQIASWTPVATTFPARFFVANGGVEQAAVADTANVQNAEITSWMGASSWENNSFNFHLNGAITGAEDTSGTVPTSLTQLNIAANHSGLPLTGWVERVEYFPRKNSAAQLNDLTLPLPTFDWHPKRDRSLVTAAPGLALTVSAGAITFDADGAVIESGDILDSITDMSGIHQEACSWIVEGITGADQSADHVLVEASDGSIGDVNSRTVLIETGSGDIEAVNEVNGSVDATATGQSVSFSSAFKASARFAENDINISAGGSAGTADTVNAIPYGASIQLNIGSDNEGNRPFVGTISRVRGFCPVALPDATLNAQTG